MNRSKNTCDDDDYAGEARVRFKGRNSSSSRGSRSVGRSSVELWSRKKKVGAESRVLRPPRTSAAVSPAFYFAQAS